MIIFEEIQHLSINSQLGGWKGASDRGMVNSVGKDYIVNDGDVMLFKHSA